MGGGKPCRVVPRRAGRRRGGAMTRSVLGMVGPSSDAAYRVLRDRIMTWELAPGQWLTERSSAVRLGLGLPQVRQALARLVADGLLQVLPRDHFRVTPVTCKSLDDLFTSWALLGPQIARLGTSAAGPAQAARLRRLITEGTALLTGPLDRDRLLRYIDNTLQIFDLLAVASGNDRLVEVNRSLAGEMGRTMTLVLAAPGSVDKYLAAGTSWYSTIDHCDADAVTAMARDVIAAGHTSATRVLHDRPSAIDRTVVPLRR
jgi:DNA-binding GntR family transcriptional regulator